MNIRSDSALTLIELLLAIVLLSFVLLVGHNLHIFSSGSLTDLRRWSEVKSDSSYVLEHMAKNIFQAIGNVKDTLNPPVRLENSSRRLIVRIDADSDGRVSSGDIHIAYEFNTVNNEIRFNPEYPDSSWESLSRNIEDCTFDYTFIENFIDVEITTCWNPRTDAPYECGSPNNPQLRMKTRMKMPAVSVN